ncbi:MAG: SDR family oxidoreductase [Prolixibacteraceae bacterium]|jgi:NAD(P)-dependent dehydrogenase (short-subunit alcohol dehydrogenase family)|nr:SDR family oxidoreductase [Prolixibacteraceae bacterium]
MINPLSLSGKNIMVVGAASETGWSIVSVLQQLGAMVIMMDKENVQQDVSNNTLPDGTISLTFDIYDVALIEEQISAIYKNLGVVHGLVYCAGIGGVRPLGLTTNIFATEMMNANFFAFLEFVRCVTKKGRLVAGGSIVAVSSVSSIKGLKSKIAYAASKAAADAAVRCMAAELSEKRIRVNSILKGWVTSDMGKDFIVNNRSIDHDNDYNRQLLGAIKPEELANTTAFLLSDAAVSITGTSLLLDGGYSL